MSAFNGSGTFVISGVGLPYVTATTISSTVANQLNTDLATGLSNCVTKDGQTTPTANIPLGGFKLTGVGNPSGIGDALVWGGAGNVSSLVINGGTTLSNYSVSTWTPTDQSGDSLSFTVSRAAYTRIGSDYFCDLTLSFPVNAGGAAVKISLPATVANVAGAGGAFAVLAATYGSPAYGLLNINTSTFGMTNALGAVISNGAMSNSQLRAQFRLPTV